MVLGNTGMDYGACAMLLGSIGASFCERFVEGFGGFAGVMAGVMAGVFLGVWTGKKHS